MVGNFVGMQEASMLRPDGFNAPGTTTPPQNMTPPGSINDPEPQMQAGSQPYSVPRMPPGSHSWASSGALGSCNQQHPAVGSQSVTNEFAAPFGGGQKASLYTGALVQGSPECAWSGSTMPQGVSPQGATPQGVTPRDPALAGRLDGIETSLKGQNTMQKTLEEQQAQLLVAVRTLITYTGNTMQRQEEQQRMMSMQQASLDSIGSSSHGRHRGNVPDADVALGIEALMGLIRTSLQSVNRAEDACLALRQAAGSTGSGESVGNARRNSGGANPFSPAVEHAVPKGGDAEHPPHRDEHALECWQEKLTLVLDDAKEDLQEALRHGDRLRRRLSKVGVLPSGRDSRLSQGSTATANAVEVLSDSGESGNYNVMSGGMHTITDASFPQGPNENGVGAGAVAQQRSAHVRSGTIEYSMLAPSGTSQMYEDAASYGGSGAPATLASSQSDSGKPPSRMQQEMHMSHSGPAGRVPVARARTHPSPSTMTTSQ
eukprot:gnl/MRDRNA2_/MRDRNA2_162483_c0_seq1.p1 gnl/MRDRNA2_/MRDRNA2_162483_c0~~gnl/MRDRNA2_/MRDRNA2_162483_c0_seq1.p1  ORF type:complete len:501 (+),score=98.41 gnl/MRDRNA2_/MRDRNA2_162483_c0_seq1:43-1503(+)